MFSPRPLLPLIALACLLLAGSTLPAEGRSLSTFVKSDTLDVSGDPQPSRMLAGYTARPIGDGDVYVSLMNILYPQVGIGITDDLSVEVGGIVAPLADAELTYVVSVRPSYRIWQRGSLDVAVDAETAWLRERRLSDTPEWAVAVRPRLLATTGTERASISGGAGVTVLETSDDQDTRAYVNVFAGGHVRLLSWMSFLNETAILPGYEENVTVLGIDIDRGFVERETIRNTTTQFVTTNGLRLHGNHFAADLGATVEYLADPLFQERTTVYPLLRFSYKF
jgi:hypothetical protein